MANNRSIPSSYWKRVERQIRIFGVEGQQKIAQTEIGICGTGGNGTWSALFSGLLGVLDLTVIDKDIVEFSNLHRSPFYTDEDVGKYKADVTKRELESRFPEMRVRAIVGDLRTPEVWEQVRRCKWFLENVDNDETRLFVNKRCIEDGINLVSTASGFRFRDGRLINAGSRVARAIHGDACLNCSVVGDITSDNATASLVLPNVIAAALGVNFVIREITGYAGSAQNKANFAMFDLLGIKLTRERILPSPGCPACEKLNSAKGERKQEDE